MRYSYSLILLITISLLPSYQFQNGPKDEDDDYDFWGPSTKRTRRRRSTTTTAKPANVSTTTAGANQYKPTPAHKPKGINGSEEFTTTESSNVTKDDDYYSSEETTTVTTTTKKKNIDTDYSNEHKEVNMEWYLYFRDKYQLPEPFPLPGRKRIVDIENMAFCQCPRVYWPVCAKNNITYLNHCIMDCLGQEMRRYGPCIYYRRSGDYSDSVSDDSPRRHTTTGSAKRLRRHLKSSDKLKRNEAQFVF